MIIAGLVKTSLIDYPGIVSAVLFTYGCNFRCKFCHNPDLVIGKSRDLEKISEKDFFDFLKKRKKILDGVVITGGEPLINKDIKRLIQKIKKLRYFVKLDTNGTKPSFLKELIEEGLIDFIAMDIKNSLTKYEETVSVPVDIIKIKKSIKIIKGSKLPYEFRSTILPRLHKEKDLEAMGKMIKGAKKFAVQGFRSGVTLDKEYELEKSFTLEELKKIQKIFKKYVENVEIRENM